MKAIWIGLVHVRPGAGCEIIDQNAYVQVVAFVEDADDFDRQVREAADHYRLHVMGIQDLEPLKERLSKHTVEKELVDKAKEAEATGYLRFGTFCTYPAN